MEKHILNLLKEHNRAIIPDLGAFFIRQQEPDIITFNSLLTFNDGMLIDSIIKKEGLSYDDASARVNRFSNHLTSELEKNKQVTINQIGKISIDKSGEKKFTPWSKLGEKEIEESSGVKKEQEQELKTENAGKEEVEKPETTTGKKKKEAEEEEPETETGKEEKEVKTKEDEITKKEKAAEEPEAVTGKEDKEAETKKAETIESEKEAADTDKEKEETQPTKAETTKGEKITEEPEIETETGKEEKEVKTKEDEITEEEKAAEKPEAEKKETVTENEGKSEKFIDKDDTGTEKQEPVIKEEPSFTLDETLKDVDIDASGDSDTQPAGEKELLAAEISRDHFTLDESNEKEQDSFGPTVPGSSLTGETKQDTIKPDTDIPPYDISDQSTKRKKRKWILPLSIIISLIIIIAAAWFIFPDPVRNIFISDQSAGEDIMPAEDIETTAGESSGEAFQETETGPEETGVTEITPSVDEEFPVTEDISKETIISTSEKKYYIVAGCFENRENAENYVEELQNKGYNSQLFGTRKNLYAVSFNSYSTKDQALSEMYRIRQSIEPDAWVLYY